MLYGQEGYLPLELAAAREHMKRIRESGFDLVFFDMLPIPDYDPAQALTFTNEPFYYFSNYFEWMKAAEENNLKLGIFADVGNQSARYPQYRSITRDEWVKILHAALGMIPESPAAWKVNGVDGVIHFGTDCVYNLKASPVPGAPMPDGGWREVWKLLRGEGGRILFRLRHSAARQGRRLGRPGRRRLSVRPGRPRAVHDGVSGRPSPGASG